jgi:hypothetical protein
LLFRCVFASQTPLIPFFTAGGEKRNASSILQISGQTAVTMQRTACRRSRLSSWACVRGCGTLCRPGLLLACGFVAVFFCFSAVFLRLKPPLYRFLPLAVKNVKPLKFFITHNNPGQTPNCCHHSGGSLPSISSGLLGGPLNGATRPNIGLDRPTDTDRGCLLAVYWQFAREPQGRNFGPRESILRAGSLSGV